MKSFLFIACLFSLPVLGVGQYYNLVYTPSPGGFDGDYQAVLDEGTTQGFTLPSTAEQEAQNQFVVDAKSNGYWGKLDILLVLAHDGDIDMCRINWVDPTSTLSTISNVIFTSDNGCNCSQVNGAGFETAWSLGDAGNNATTTSAAAGVWREGLNTGSSTTYYMFGDGSGNADNTMRSRGSQFGASIASNGIWTVFLSGGDEGEGLFSVVKDGTTLDLRKDNGSVGSTTYAAYSFSTNEMYFMAYSLFGNLYSCDPTKKYRLFYAGSLDATDVSNLFTDFDTYLTTIGI